MILIVLQSSHLQQESQRYVLAPAEMADPEMVISQTIHEEYLANPRYNWSDLAARLVAKGFVLPSDVMVSEKFWDSPKTKVDDAFFVMVPATADHEYAGKRLDVITNAAGDHGFGVLIDPRGQMLDAHDMVRKLDADHEVGDSYDQVPLGELFIPPEQFAQDTKALERAKEIMLLSGFSLTEVA